MLSVNYEEPDLRGKCIENSNQVATIKALAHVDWCGFTILPYDEVQTSQNFGDVISELPGHIVRA
jgi:hypothetical protein